MNTLPEKISIQEKTLYQIVAKQCSVSPRYVGMISRNERIPKRGKGLKVKAALDKIKNNS